MKGNKSNISGKHFSFIITFMIGTLFFTAGQARADFLDKITESWSEVGVKGDKAKDGIDSGVNNVDAIKAQLDQTRAQIDEARAQLNQTRARLDETKQKSETTLNEVKDLASVAEDD